MASYADVAVPVGVRKTFAYSVPQQLEGAAGVGARVIVPFGRKLLTGFIVGLGHDRPKGDFHLRPIRDLLDPRPIVPAQLVQIGLWVAEYYFTAPGEALRALFPVGSEIAGTRRFSLTPATARLLEGGLRPQSADRQENLLLDILAREGPMSVARLATRSGLRSAERPVDSLLAAGLVEAETVFEPARVRAKQQLGLRRSPAEPRPARELTAAQARLFSCLAPDGTPLPLQSALRAAGCNAGVARALAAKGVVEIFPLRVQRNPEELTDISAKTVHVLTDAQQRAFDELCRMLGRRTALRCLLHGVTGSGKTEIYLRLIAEVLKHGETALFLVPEIGLTPLLSRIALSHFPDKVALLHSGMSQGERFDQWNRIRAGGAPVVVGTRSAVFAPLNNLRLTIIDEEQDPSYKQDESPCYHAREVAWQRMKQTSGLLLMGSATPSVETYYLATRQRAFACLSLPERIEARPLADVAIVDMAVEFQRHGRNIVISQPLRETLEECLRRGEQAIVLLNRRGYSRTLLCRSCGHAVSCTECSVSLTYHQSEGRLICHYCGVEKKPPSLCESCGGKYIYYVGIGTEQLDEMIRTLLPHARVARVDRDTTRRRGSLRTILLEFAAGKLDILVGTQMVAKGHDFPNVTLVGVVAGDAGLAFPDFRSAERTFQLLTQVAGRAGRGTAPGRVVIQAFYPEHYALQNARRQDYDGFFRREIEYRELMGYPPMRGLVQILITDAKAAKARQSGEKIAAALKAGAAGLDADSRPHILGPAFAPVEKLRGKYRIQLLIKSKPGTDVLPLLRDAFARLEEQKVSLRNAHIDVDPLSLL